LKTILFQGVNILARVPLRDSSRNYFIFDESS